MTLSPLEIHCHLVCLPVLLPAGGGVWGGASPLVVDTTDPTGNVLPAAGWKFQNAHVINRSYHNYYSSSQNKVYVA